ncbi:MAG: carbohydrate ABC transporter permease [Defluviitaleaceae bacterium]|nr:carbohydrate ABC transporter permease [Defluviitaleaceae bacterium]MCL2274501.1 carbohydrate ABC transporter permease [Defluviitaleaceae bacterium]
MKRINNSKFRKNSRFLAFIPLVALALLVWWVLWFMGMGSLMSLEELNATIGAALANDGSDERAFFPFIPAWPGLQPLVRLLLDTPHFFVMFWNTFRLVIPSVLGQLVLGAPAAWALSRFRFRGRKILITVYIALMLMPFQVTMVPNFLVIDRLGLMDNRLAVILPFAFSAFPVFIMLKGFDAVPRALLEAASIDGANAVRTFVHVGLPLGVPSILAALVLGFLEVWGAIEQPMTFLGDPSAWPLSLFLPQIVAEELGLAMVASLFMLLPAVLFFLFGQKYLELGIQAAGIKE